LDRCEWRGFNTEARNARKTPGLFFRDFRVSVVILFFMHELGIAASILDCVDREAERHPGQHISKVGVKIGELAGVDADALQFGFEVLVKDTEREPLTLDVEFIPRVQRCSKCEHEFRMREFDPRCPLCSDFATTCVSGEELDIAYMEVDE
jgi:hydrogenase nickel incorporation protein HypA/HybF